MTDRETVFEGGEIIQRSGSGVRFKPLEADHATVWLPAGEVEEVEGGIRLPLWLAEDRWG